jgi:hypothetical protein
VEGEDGQHALVLAVGTGVVVIAVAGAIVLEVLFVTVSMRGRQKRAAERRGEASDAEGVSRSRQLLPVQTESGRPSGNKQTTLVSTTSNPPSGTSPGAVSMSGRVRLAACSSG